MPRKLKKERTDALNERDELEQLLSGTAKEMTTAIKLAESLLPERPTVGFLDYAQVKIDANTEAYEVVRSLTGFYLDTKMILKEDEAYIKSRNNVDTMTLSSLMFQMKTAEHAIIKILEEIDNGMAHNQVYVALSSLQKSKMEIIKHIAQYMVILENNYKNMRDDYRIKLEELKLDGANDGGIQIEENSNQIRGTRRLMEQLRQVIPEHRAQGQLKKDIEDVE